MPEDDADELVEFWTLLDERTGALLGGRRGVLVFARPVGIGLHCPARAL